MFKIKFIAVILIFLIIGCISIINTHASYIFPCTCEDEFNSFYTDDDNSDTKYVDIFWTENNLSLLSEDEKKVLDNLQSKMITSTILDKDDIEQMSKLKDIVFKSKLTEHEFNDFKEIITKKRNGEKLTTQEVFRLKSYFTSIQ